MSKTPETLSHDVTAPLQATKKTAPFQILIGAAVGTLILPIVYPWVCNHALPIDDALRAKDFFFDTAKSTLPIAITGTCGGAVVGSLFKTGGKVAAQLAPGMATDATPNGEGIGGSAPANEVPTVPESAPVASPAPIVAPEPEFN